MICSVCQEEVSKCENGACGEDIQKRAWFYCFGGVHFCSRACWKVWFLSGEEERLTKARGEKRVRTIIKMIEERGEVKKRKGVIMYEMRCANCDALPETAEKIITGGSMEDGEWVCSDKCYDAYIYGDQPESIRGQVEE